MALYDGALLADTEFRGTLAAEAPPSAPPADVERAFHEPAALDRGYHAAGAAAAPARRTALAAAPVAAAAAAVAAVAVAAAGGSPPAAAAGSRPGAVARARPRAAMAAAPAAAQRGGSGPLSPTSSPGRPTPRRKRGWARRRRRSRRPTHGRPSALGRCAARAVHGGGARRAAAAAASASTVPYAPYPNVELQPVPYAHYHPHHGGAAGGAGPFGGGGPACTATRRPSRTRRPLRRNNLRPPLGSVVAGHVLRRWLHPAVPTRPRRRRHTGV